MRSRLVVDTKPDFTRDWSFVFLQDVPDKTDRPCITQKPRTIHQGNPNSQQIAPIAPVAFAGSERLRMRSATAAMARISRTYGPAMSFAAAISNNRGARGSTGLWIG
jgi:hypothetical protein